MTTQPLIELADKYAFFMPGSEEGAKVRQQLVAALQAQAAEIAALKEKLAVETKAANHTDPMALIDRYRDLKVGEGTAQARAAIAQALEAQAAEIEAFKSQLDDYTTMVSAEIAALKEKLAVETKVAGHWMQEACNFHNLVVKLEALKADAARGRYMIDNGCWHRGEEQTHLAVLVQQGSDLSCSATRRAAIDAAMKDPS
jgi:hypothetical protein